MKASKAKWVAAILVFGTIATTAAGVVAYNRALEYGYVKVQLPHGLAHRHWIVGQAPIADEYLVEKGWACVGEHHSGSSRVSLRCGKGADVREIETGCDGKAFLHIDRDEVDIEIGCVIERQALD